MDESKTITGIAPPLFLTGDDVMKVFDWQAAIAALRAAYEGESAEAMFPPRVMARAPGNWLRVLCGFLPGGVYMGSKQIAVSTGARHASYLISLFDRRSVGLAALLDGNFITGARTAATSALAVDALCRPGRLRVAVLGSGFEAKMHVRALAAMDRVATLSVFSPTPASRERFATEIGAELNVPVSDASSPREIVGDADLVICAARSRNETAILDGAWLGGDAVIVSVGSTLPEQRELDSVTIDRARLIIADMADEVSHDTGDMLAAREAGVLFADKLHSLADLISGRLPAGETGGGIRIYKSVGASIQDIAVAVMCFERARDLGIGTRMAVSIAPVQK